MVTVAQKQNRQDNRRTALEIFVTLLAIAGIMYGAVNYFASDADLILVDMRLEQKIVGDSIYNLYDQKTQLESKWGNDMCGTWQGEGAHADKKRYLRILTQLKQMETKQEQIIKFQTEKK